MSARDDSGLVNCQVRVPTTAVLDCCTGLCQGPCKQGNWQLKRVSSVTGPHGTTALSDAIRRPHSVPGQVGTHTMTIFHLLSTVPLD